MMSSSIGTTVDLSEIDTDHLARQALKLFSKRYGRQFDMYLNFGTLHRKLGYISYENYVKETGRLFGVPDDKARQITDRDWLHLTGGCTKEQVGSFDRQKCIDLCIRGYHSKDKGHVEKLKKILIGINDERFDFIDTNHDGSITADEYYTFAEKQNITTNFKGVFEALDLNGDGEISREESTQCFLGFHLSCDEERYNHLMGMAD